MSFQLTYSKGASTSSSTEFNWQFFIIMLIAMAISTWLLILSLRYNPEPQFHSEVHHQIGGWLIVFAIGLVLTPIILISGFVSNEYFNPVQWQILANTSFSAYNPLLGALVVFEMIGSIFLIWFSILSLVLFFQRRTSAPRVIVIFYSAYLGFLFFDNIGAKYFNLFSEKETMNNFKEIGKVLVRTAIWIPYLLIAERVKGTFVKRL